MPDLSVVLAGFLDALTITNFLYILLGVTLGQVIAAIPGLGTVMALAVAIPFTISLDTLTAVAFLISISKGGTVGGAVSAILLNTPGSAEAAATTFDGHPMAKKGQAGKAMKYSLYYSIFGDVGSDIVLILVAAPLAMVALKMGPIEICALMVLAFTVISGLVGDSLIKGVISVGLGFLIGAIGLDPGYGTPRFTFNSYELYDGIPLGPLALGMLAVSVIIREIAQMNRGSSGGSTLTVLQAKSQSVTLKELLANRVVAFRAFVIGTIIGAIPGLGSSTAGMISYSVTKQSAKDPEAFGTGDPRGIAASETANSAVVGANLIPLLTLGIPGNIGAALLVGAFVLHGVQPGPLLFENQGQLVYGLFGAMLMANVANLGVGQVCMRLWAKVVTAPSTVVYPCALIICTTGMYLITGSPMGVVFMVGAAFWGYLMTSFGYPFIAFIVAFILTPQLEASIVQAVRISGGDWTIVLRHPIALALLAMSGLMIFYLLPRKRKAEAAAA
ncbi:tripartite tricarboxylate transporter permease [Pseudoroseicyclus sp. CXY001]|uniref:tripartite tricarboxylate transporter permease n=1 Tax=Pseudoroseicyclus sp. CXY001 TaxID=3242492 RepID=UPI00358DB3B6